MLAAYADYLQDADINSNVEVQINPTYTLVFYGYLGHVSTPTAFDLFTDIPAASTLYPPTNGSLTELLLGFGDAGLTDDGISHSGTFSHKVTDSKFLKESYEVYQKAVASLPSGAVLSYVPQGVIPNLVTKGESQNGGNLLGLEATPQVCMSTPCSCISSTYLCLSALLTSRAGANIFVQFPENVTESVATGAVDDAIEKLTSSAKSQDLFLPYIFVNDAGPEQKPLQSFGKENLNYIKKVAKKYDPRGVMQKLQNKAYFVSE